MADHPHSPPNVNIPQVDQTPKHHSTQKPFSPPPLPPPPPPPPPQERGSEQSLLPLKSCMTSTSSGASSSHHGSSSSNTLMKGGKHPIYRGIRKRSGKWVSEIREPRKTTRIWLGTYPSPEMAAAAYDVAALALKGSDVILNFPDRVGSYPPVPEKALPPDIRSAAGKAAAMMNNNTQSATGSTAATDAAAAAAVVDGDGDQLLTMEEGGDVSCDNVNREEDVKPRPGDEYIDEDDLLNMPNLLVHMAEGMLVSPPRIISSVSDEYDSPGNSDAESLWGYF